MPLKTRIVCQNFDPEQFGVMLHDLGRGFEEAWEGHGFEQPEIRLHLLLVEALNNAWEHGNRHDPAKSITVDWWFSDDGDDFYFSVADQGAGFDLSAVPDPRAAHALGRDRGRGVFLIRTYADSAEWTEGGRVLTVRLARKPKIVRWNPPGTDPGLIH